MGHELNVWGTDKGESIEDAVTQLIDNRQVIRVDQVELESGKVFRAKDGFVLEVLVDAVDVNKDCVRIAKLGTTVHAYIDRALVIHAGDLVETRAEIAAVAAEEQRQRAEELEVDAMFAGIVANDSPSQCAGCSRELDIRKHVTRLPDGRLHCGRCAVSFKAPSSQPSAA